MAIIVSPYRERFSNLIKIHRHKKITEKKIIQIYSQINTLFYYTKRTYIRKYLHRNMGRQANSKNMFWGISDP